MEMANSSAFTREAAQQSMKNEVRLNAAYIDGDWVTIEASDSVGEHALYDPNSGEVIAITRLCNSAQVESAAHAAARAYPSWSQTSVNERACYLQAIADTMAQQFDKLVGLVSIE